MSSTSSSTPLVTSTITVNGQPQAVALGGQSYTLYLLIFVSTFALLLVVAFFLFIRSYYRGRSFRRLLMAATAVNRGPLDADQYDLLWTTWNGGSVQNLPAPRYDSSKPKIPKNPPGLFEREVKICGNDNVDQSGMGVGEDEKVGMQKQPESLSNSLDFKDIKPVSIVCFTEPPRHDPYETKKSKNKSNKSDKSNSIHDPFNSNFFAYGKNLHPYRYRELLTAQARTVKPDMLIKEGADIEVAVLIAMPVENSFSEGEGLGEGGGKVRVGLDEDEEEDEVPDVAFGTTRVVIGS